MVTAKLTDISTSLSSHSLKIILQQHQVQALSPDKITLYRLNTQHRVIYRCVFRGSSKISHQQVLNIAGLNFQIKPTDSGELDFYLCDRSLGIWLENLPQISPSVENNYPAEIVSPLFALQYAHSRCCALLRLAHQQGLIKLKDQHFREISYSFKFNSTRGDFLLIMPPARALVNQIIAVVDAFGSDRQQNWLKLTSNLAKVFLEFGDRCPLWGVNKQNPQLTQALLSLIALTQMLLQMLLIDKLRIGAIVELL